MKKIFVVFSVLSLFMFACGEEKSNKLATAATPKKVNGEKIYKRNCVICHGTRGDMGASGAHDLTASVLPVEERVAIITKGRNTMVGFEAILDEKEIAAVAQYTLTLNKDLQN